MKYKRFETTWKKLIDEQYKPKMLEFENANTDDVEFTDIILTKISSSAEKQLENMWVSIEVGLKGNDFEDGEVPPMPTRYYLKTTPTRISLQHDFLEDNFTNIWDTPSYVEKELVQAVLSDMIEMHPQCLMTMTNGIIRKLIDDHYIELTQFDADTMNEYFAKFGETDFLTQEAKDVFIF